MTTETTPERLRTAAWRIVRDEGIAAATSRRITEVADANLAAITYHFGSKDALIGAALVEQLRRWTEPLTEALAAPATATDERMAAAVATLLASFAERGDEVVAILRALMTNEALPGVADAVTTWLREFRGVVAAVMVEQQADGLVPATVEPDAMAGVFTALGIGVIAQAAIDGSAPNTGAIVGQFLQLLVRPDPASSGQRSAL